MPPSLSSLRILSVHTEAAAHDAPSGRRVSLQENKLLSPFQEHQTAFLRPSPSPPNLVDIFFGFHKLTPGFRFLEKALRVGAVKRKRFVRVPRDCQMVAFSTIANSLMCMPSKAETCGNLLLSPAVSPRAQHVYNKLRPPLSAAGSSCRCKDSQHHNVHASASASCLIPPTSIQPRRKHPCPKINVTSTTASRVAAATNGPTVAHFPRRIPRTPRTPPRRIPEGGRRLALSLCPPPQRKAAQLRGG